jgi:hypothetical protein
MRRRLCRAFAWMPMAFFVCTARAQTAMTWENFFRTEPFAPLATSMHTDVANQQRKLLNLRDAFVRTLQVERNRERLAAGDVSRRPQYGKLALIPMRSQRTSRLLTVAACLMAAIFVSRAFSVAHRLFPMSPNRMIGTVPGVYSTGVARPPLAVDLNHDGRLDSVTVASEGHGGQTIQVKLDGVGNRELRYDSRGGSRSVVYAADVDHDTNLDLVRESEDGFEPATIWLGDGKGNFVLLAEPSPIVADFYNLPRVPYLPYSSNRQRQAYSTVIEKRNRSPIPAPGASTNSKAVSEPQRKQDRQDTSARIRRELLLWIARTINAPPPSIG